MSLDLLNQLEEKVETTVAALDQLRQEVDELKQENASLKEEKQAWESKLGNLLNKFSALEAGSPQAEEEESPERNPDEPQIPNWS
ncbi:cell division protein ZapB [Marinospirillum perlucidum]|uniref:cell division protein ZapB n=1 Tax=Marinospirillum perlucidum TaxID=1982602 RepID=UPI000DF445D8|nr:cell division protein ZapB [Marinospirillum perlucidum]